MLKPQDIVVLLKVHCLGEDWTYQELAVAIEEAKQGLTIGQKNYQQGDKLAFNASPILYKHSSNVK